MASNSWGQFFRFTSFGESHGVAMGVVIDGVPPGLALDEPYIQQFLDARRPGQNRFVSPRQEPDRVQILSGVYQGRTLGTPVALLIPNTDARSADYNDIAKAYRPGHADYTYDKKYGHRDPRGGGRASARETVARVAAGAVARRILGDSIKIEAAVIQIGPHASTKAPEDWVQDDWAQVSQNPFFAADASMIEVWQNALDAASSAGTSLGAVLQVQAQGVPAGWGDPIYQKLDAEIAAALMSINAVKAVEIGSGFALAGLEGHQSADIMQQGHSGIEFAGNHNGGILGGISTGQPIVARFAVKPTSSIRISQPTVTPDATPTTISSTGRHDPCVGIRAAPIASAMLACVLADAALRGRALTGAWHITEKE